MRFSDLDLSEKVRLKLFPVPDLRVNFSNQGNLETLAKYPRLEGDSSCGAGTSARQMSWAGVKRRMKYSSIVSTGVGLPIFAGKVT